MYIRLVTFRASPGKKAEVAAIADQFIPRIKARPGNMDCRFLMDDEAGEYGMVITWNTKENAETAKAVIGPELIPILQNLAGEPLNIKLYEAYGA